MTEARDTAGVIAPPPLIALAAVVLGLALDWLLPAYVLTVLLSLAGAHRHRLSCSLRRGRRSPFPPCAASVRPAPMWSRGSRRTRW